MVVVLDDFTAVIAKGAKKKEKNGQLLIVKIGRKKTACRITNRSAGGIS
jgi:hypothetical protein